MEGKLFPGGRTTDEQLDSNPEPPVPTPYHFTAAEPSSCQANCGSQVTAAIQVTTCPKIVGHESTAVTRAVSYYMLTVEEFFLLKDLEAQRSGLGPVDRR